MDALERRYGFDPNAHHEQLFGQNGLAFTLHERIPNSRAALNVAELGRDRGVHGPLHERLMTAYWADGRDIADPDVLAELGAEAGLDGDEVRDAARRHPYQQRIADSTAGLLEIGGGGVPAFAIDDRIVIPGAQPRDLFERVLQKLGYEAGSVETTDDRGPGAS